MVCDGYREDFRHILTRYAELFRGNPGDKSLTVPRYLTAVHRHRDVQYRGSNYRVTVRIVLRPKH